MEKHRETLSPLRVVSGKQLAFFRTPTVLRIVEKDLFGGQCPFRRTFERTRGERAHDHFVVYNVIAFTWLCRE